MARRSCSPWVARLAERNGDEGLHRGLHALASYSQSRSGQAELRLADDLAMHPGDVATLTPPGDIHNHGHVLGTGPSPYSLILPGDDMYLFERQEYDPEQGTWRTLTPGDPGRSHR
jgi:hypothetical protein